MLGVVICDNDKKLLKSYTLELGSTIENDNLDAEILLSTTHPTEVLSFFDVKTGLFFIILELQYASEIKGIDIAQRIREQDRDSYIVFATNYPEQVQTVFTGLIRPAGFLVKPVKKKELLSVFLMAYSDHVNILQKEDCYTIAIGAKVYKLPYRTICFFEAAQKRIYINTETQRIGYYDSLEAIGKKLNSGKFVRCHKGFIVNVDKIAQVDFSEMQVFLNNGACIPLSRTYKNVLKQIV